ncbi:DUF2202 domain-containing protein [Chloroflexota bacterium]|nr:DUF2202 domain-containing protein [Chloroflexota bacterium]
MNNKKPTTLKILGLAALISLALTACSTAIPTSKPVSAEPVAVEETFAINDDTATDTETVAGVEPSTEDDPTVVVASAAASTLHASGLTEAEVEGLLYMREEEKLAHDVYVTLYGIWGTPVFQNIANSEQTHTEAVKNLLDIYGLEDPAISSPVGVFVNPDLQALYDQLVDLGSKSQADALKVGAAIEEIDILDLQANLEIVTAADVRQVYENLLFGSENHLRAFTSVLAQQTGEIYEPQYMDQTAYDAIVAESIQSGAGLSQGGRGGGRRP